MSKKSSLKTLKKHSRQILRQVAGKRLMRFGTLKWAALGLGAYGLLHLMRNKGIFARQASTAIDLVDRGAQNLVKVV